MAHALRATEKVNSVNDDEELRHRGYVVGPTLGEGSYAKVKSAFSVKVNKKVALKIINRRKAPKDFQLKFLPRELEVMQLIHHPHVIELYEIMQFNGKVYIAMELAGHGDLLEYIKLRGAIPDEKARHLFQQLVSAIEYLHSIKIIHRDLKCENILLDGENRVKVSDFGFARLMAAEDLSSTFCGSAAYAAPEVLSAIPYKGAPYDVWSMGVILYIMVCGSMPFDDSNIKKMIRFQTERRVAFSRSRTVPQPCKDVIHRMLEASISARATVTQVRRMPWLQETGSMIMPALQSPTNSSRPTTPATPAPPSDAKPRKSSRNDDSGRSTPRSSQPRDSSVRPREHELRQMDHDSRTREHLATSSRTRDESRGAEQTGKHRPSSDKGKNEKTS